MTTAEAQLPESTPPSGTTFSWTTEPFEPWAGTVGESPSGGAILRAVVPELVQRSTVPLVVVPRRGS
jgi:hypothetical protein